MEEKIAKLVEYLKESNNLVFFGGAGVSTASNIPDFRSSDGLYSKKLNRQFSPEEAVSHTFLMRHPEEFYEFYKQNLIYPDAKPNACHEALVKLEKMGKLKAIVTQNIDGLHQKAGSKNVLELHGSIYRNYCMKCGKKYGIERIQKSEGIPRCACGGIIRPDVVLYEENLPEGVFEQAIEEVRNASLLIIGGTSLAVYPAAGLLQYFRGSHLVLINKSETPYDSMADLVIREPIGEVFSKLAVIG